MTNFKGIIDFGSAFYTGIPYPGTVIFNQYVANPVTFANVEGAPLDGTVLNMESNTNQNISEKVYSTTPYAITDFSSAIANYLIRDGLGWGRCKYQFAAITITNSTGISYDWFDDVNIPPVVANFSLVADFVNQSKLYGILFDAETYGVFPWRYNDMPAKATYSFEEYEVQVYKIARQIATNWKNFKEDINVMFTRGFDAYYQAFPAQGRDANDYGLYNAFLNGMYDELGLRRYNGVHTPINQRCASPGVSGTQLIISTLNTFPCLSALCVQQYNDLLKGITDSRARGDTDYFDVMSKFSDWLFLTRPPFDNVTPALSYFTPQQMKDSIGYMIDDDVQWVVLFQQSVDPHFYDNTLILNPQYFTKLWELRVERGLP